MKSRIAALIALFALPLATLSAPPLRADQAPDRARAATVTVTGEGHVAAAPDMATLTLGVTTRGDSPAAALRANSAEVEALLALLGARGVAARDMQTSGLSLGPVYDHSGSGEAKITGYQVSNMVTIRVRALDQLGGLLDAVVAGGANQLNGLSFGIADPEPLEDRAREAAVADATRRAGLLAAAAGLELGPVVTISEGGASAAPQPMYARASEMAVPVAGGEIGIDASVVITFRLRAK